MERSWRKSKTFGEACRHALSGIGHAFKREYNLRVQLVIYGVTLALAGLIGMPPQGIALLTLASVVVLTLELLNTALEALADTVSPQYHDGLRQVKDVAAGAVLIASFGAVIIGLLLFIPQLL